VPDLSTDYVAHDSRDSVSAFNTTNLEVNSVRARVATLEAGGGGGGGGGGFSNGIIVASSQASAADKARAHYVCDGAADQEQINLAVDRASVLTGNARTANTLALGDASSQSAGATATQAGKVILTGGRFNISAPILMRTGVWLQGSGFLTELRATSNSGTGVIRLIPQAGLGDGSAGHLVMVSNLWIYGNYGSGGTCKAIDFDMTGSNAEPKTKGYPDVNPDSYHYVVDCLITGFAGANRDGVFIHSTGTANNRGNVIRGLQVRDCGRDGISLSTASDSFITECHVGGSVRYGYNISTGNTKVATCKSFYSDAAGFYFGSGRGTLAGLEAQDDFVGFYFDGTPYTATGLTADSCLTGIRVNTDRLVMTSFSIFNRSDGTNTEHPVTSVGLQFDSAYADMLILGQVDDSNITTKISATLPGSRSFMRVSNGATLVSVGA